MGTSYRLVREFSVGGAIFGFGGFTMYFTSTELFEVRHGFSEGGAR